MLSVSTSLNMPRLQYESPVMLSRGNVLNAAFDTKYGKVPLAADQELQYVSYYIEKRQLLENRQRDLRIYIQIQFLDKTLENLWHDFQPRHYHRLLPALIRK